MKGYRFKSAKGKARGDNIQERPDTCSQMSLPVESHGVTLNSPSNIVMTHAKGRD